MEIRDETSIKRKKVDKLYDDINLNELNNENVLI